ncbi:spore coat protein [Paenibacillus sp. LBL]|uniref:spore coat protein n=1 Tax=Paenibacillus sp. LBL TaxID=2940563 RepID=UPI002475D0C8|nr:spore coat protein [Paenibacillus sp. LBL]
MEENIVSIKPNPSHLAWHETMKLHEITASQTNSLIGFKMSIHNIKDKHLHALYAEAIRDIEQNLRELLPYFPEAPTGTRSLSDSELTAFYAGQLLGYAKSSILGYASAITETATPSLKETFHKQMHRAIELHTKIFNYMLERGLYPAYNLKELLENDVKNANKALGM